MTTISDSRTKPGIKSAPIAPSAAKAKPQPAAKASPAAVSGHSAKADSFDPAKARPAVVTVAGTKVPYPTQPVGPMGIPNHARPKWETLVPVAVPKAAFSAQKPFALELKARHGEVFEVAYQPAAEYGGGTWTIVSRQDNPHWPAQARPLSDDEFPQLSALLGKQAPASLRKGLAETSTKSLSGMQLVGDAGEFWPDFPYSAEAKVNGKKVTLVYTPDLDKSAGQWAIAKPSSPGAGRPLTSVELTQLANAFDAQRKTGTAPHAWSSWVAQAAPRLSEVAFSGKQPKLGSRTIEFQGSVEGRTLSFELRPRGPLASQTTRDLMVTDTQWGSNYGSAVSSGTQRWAVAESLRKAGWTQLADELAPRATPARPFVHTFLAKEPACEDVPAGAPFAFSAKLDREVMANLRYAPGEGSKPGRFFMKVEGQGFSRQETELSAADRTALARQVVANGSMRSWWIASLLDKKVTDGANKEM